jgi:hypothetical protein
VDRLARVALVGVVLEVVATLCDLKVVLGDDLVKGVGTTGENLAGVAVAENVAGRVLVERGGPLSGTAVASSVVARHV